MFQLSENTTPKRTNLSHPTTVGELHSHIIPTIFGAFEFGFQVSGCSPSFSIVSAISLKLLEKKDRFDTHVVKHREGQILKK